ncbi:uncharacterized protein A4U43_C07F130 [Asparagus officinalis]|uniref:Transcription factor MYBS1 n=1 Tax=Asparagus officinalis TaxID=4686 RepID=A0A5P1E8C2_ASPOF|nr:transcription factor DIVARICATA-like [Asparagus officinalis]ONK62078.1 uncharacterized protein A4U43_C07F130 [Asparagus officinalis]
MVTKSWMEVLSPTSSYSPNSTWVLGEKKSGSWTQQENKIFENALAHFDSRTPDRWEKVAALIPGKTVRDVIAHYHDLEDDVNYIEAGLIPLPGYSTCLDLGAGCFDDDDDDDGDGINQSYFVGGKRGRFSDHERKKGAPWTEDEHRLFLLGLIKHGRGDWRSISRNFVITRNPTQVASHAQKYFNRRNSSNKDKRRASIHDITVADMTDNSPSSPSQSSTLSMKSAVTAVPVSPGSDQTKEAAARVYSRSMLPDSSTNPFGIQSESQNSYRGALHDPMARHQTSMLF